MKSIVIEFNQSSDGLDEIIKSIDTYFKIVNDSKDRFDRLRFVEVDAEFVNIDINNLGIELRDILKPHIFISIYKSYIYVIEVEL